MTSPAASVDDRIIDRIIGREGGYLDDPFGGPTKYGITQLTLTKWRGRPCTADDVQNMPESEARAIYLAWYVKPFDDVAGIVREQVIDIGVNSGAQAARTILALARALHPAMEPNTAIALERIKFYARQVKACPAKAKDLPGWVNRAIEFVA